MTFKQFEKSDNTRPRISLRKSGSIGVNGSAIQEHFESSKHVKLYYDADNDRVGIEPLYEDSNGAYTLQKRDGDQQGGSIHAKAFMREYDLIPESTQQYKLHWSEDHGLVYINTDNPVLTYDNE